MNLALQKELNNADVDWEKIKDILKEISQALEAVAKMIPVGIIKNILLGLAAVISLVIQMLPDLSSNKL